MKIRKELVKRTIAGDVILVPVGNTSLELKGLLTLNETSESIWDLLPQCENVDEIVEKMLDEYDVDENVLRADVEGILSRLRELEII